MSGYFRDLAAAVSFDSAKAVKADLFAGDHLFVGLNCFEPRQTQRLHTDARADKVYRICIGRTMMSVGDETREAGPGTVVWAPADVPHGVREALERTVMLVGIAPAPPAR